MSTGSREPVKHHHQQQHWPVLAWLSVAGALLFALAGLTSLPFFEGIDPREYKGLLLPALVIGLGIAFATVYIKLDAALDEGEAKRTKLRNDVQEAIAKFEKLRK